MHNSDLEFKRQVLDTKSASFCGAKWYNATIWLGSGMSTSCHHPPAHLVDIEEAKRNPKAIHNTPQKKLDRQQMQAGERPPGCEYCWKIEDIKRDNISDRVYKSKIYTIKDLDDAFTQDPESDIDLRTLEISFDRTCQFACSYCNPAFSSTWVRDIKQNGPYRSLVSDGRNHFTHDHSSAQLYKYGETNPYVEAFFKWWETDLHKTLDELRITGGEPLMSAHTWQLLDWFKQNKGKSTTRLAINSNLGKDVDVDRLLASVDQPIDLYIIISPVKEYSLEYLSGVSLGLFEYARNMGEVKAPFTYFGGILGEHQLVKTKKYDEILFTDQGLILEGSTFSFFAVKGSQIITPPTDGKILESVTRKNVIQGCLDGFKFEERPILVEEIASFDEAFITSANRGVVPVLKIDGSLISSSVGLVTSSIKERYWSLIS